MISPIVKERLADEEVLEKDPFGVYIVAHRWSFADEAKGAVQRLTLTEIMESPSSKDPQNLDGEDLFRLFWFVQQRGDEAKRVIRAYLERGTTMRNLNQLLAASTGSAPDPPEIGFRGDIDSSPE